MSRTGGQFLMSTVAVASLERSSLQMTAVVITQAEWLTCRQGTAGLVRCKTKDDTRPAAARESICPIHLKRQDSRKPLTSTIILTVGRVVEMF